MPGFLRINSSLTDANTSESFNYGIKDGVRGFYTSPSRADDSFIPFKSKIKYINVSIPDGTTQFTYLASQIGDTAEIVGAGMISRSHQSWQDLKVEYTSSQARAIASTAKFCGNWVMRIWYVD